MGRAVSSGSGEMGDGGDIGDEGEETGSGDGVGVTGKGVAGMELAGMELTGMGGSEKEGAGEAGIGVEGAGLVAVGVWEVGVWEVLAGGEAGGSWRLRDLRDLALTGTGPVECVVAGAVAGGPSSGTCTGFWQCGQATCKPDMAVVT